MRATADEPGRARTGLFANRALSSAAGLAGYAQTTLGQARRLVAAVTAATTAAELQNVVRDLDRLSDLLCRVIDMADFVRLAHPDGGMAAAAAGAHRAAYAYMQELNTTSALHDALARATRDAAVARRLSAEERKVAALLRADFEKYGVGLPREARARFVQLSGEIAELGAAFSGGAEAHDAFVEVDSARLDGIDPLVARSLTRAGRTRLPTTGLAAHHVLATAADGDVRRALFVASRSSSARQLATLERLLRARARQAALLGCGDGGYAQLALQDTMARTPTAVVRFLTALAAANRPAALRELAQLRTAKAAAGLAAPFEPWDHDYYAHRLPQPPQSADALNPTDALRDFFSLGTVMQGISRLLTRLYGVRLVPRAPLPGETWHADVRRLDVVSESDGHIAVIYCDLLRRADKPPHAAHFTLRSSRRLAPDELADAAAAGLPAGDGMAIAAQPGGAVFQLPTIALLCDFARPAAAGTPALLGLADVLTLFHEMGHAVHSALGRTALQTVAGTRCPADWVELPSLLMEFFARDARVLALFARHHATGTPLPPARLHERLARLRQLEATDTRCQIALALLDQRYHSAEPLSADPPFCSTRVWREVEAAVALVPPAAGTSWQGFFTHLHGYAATYYAYLFGHAIAARVWRELFAADPLARDRGERFREDVLRWGGARDPWVSLAALLARPDLAAGGEPAMAEVGRWGCGAGGGT